jgi:lipopolysaccharide transport system permease protein
MNATGILNPGEVGIPYPAYVLISSSIWGLFMGFYGAAAGTLGAGGGFIMQVKYPHEALLIKQVAQHLANFSITFVINIIVLLLFQVVPSWGILLFPIMIIPLFLLGGAIGLIIV